MIANMYFAFYSILLLISFCQGSCISDSVLERLASLEQKHSELIGVIENLAVQLQVKDETIELLSMNVEDLKARIAYLETGIQRPGENDVPVENSGDFSKTSGYSFHDMKSIADNSGVHPVDVKKIRSVANQGQSNRIVRQSEVIAFHAVHDKTEIRHNGVNQNLVLEAVVLNLAKGYYEQNGVFVAPRTGLYIFSASVLTFDKNQVVVVEMVKNGVILANIYGYSNAGYHDQGSATVITQLNVADLF